MIEPFAGLIKIDAVGGMFALQMVGAVKPLTFGGRVFFDQIDPAGKFIFLPVNFTVAGPILPEGVFCLSFRTFQGKNNLLKRSVFCIVFLIQCRDIFVFSGKVFAEQVLHIPGLGFDGLVGYSPIAMAKNAIGLAVACDEYGASFFANGASPSAVLEHPGVIKNPERVREAWHRAYGSGNAHRTAILEEGMKYTPISIPNNEAQFLETRKFQIEEIARLYRVPLHMIGDLDHATFSNIEHLSLEFVKYTLDPWLIRWEQSLMKALLSDSEKGKYFIKFNVEGLLRGDYASRMSGYATARQNGWMSANDIRELEDMNLIPEEDGGNLYLVNGSMSRLADAGIAYQKTEMKEDTTQ